MLSKYLLNIYVYTHRFVVLSLGQRSLFLQWVVANTDSQLVKVLRVRDVSAQPQKVLDSYRRLYQPRPTHPTQVSGNTKEEGWEECKSQRTGRQAMKG